MKKINLFLPHFFVEVAPVATRDDKLEGFEPRLNALPPFEEVGVKGIVRPEPNAGKAVLRLPGYPFQIILWFLLGTTHGVEAVHSSIKA